MNSVGDVCEHLRCMWAPKHWALKYNTREYLKDWSLTFSKDEVIEGMHSNVKKWQILGDSFNKNVGVLKKGKGNYTKSINLIWKGVYTVSISRIFLEAVRLCDSPFLSIMKSVLSGLFSLIKLGLPLRSLIKMAAPPIFHLRNGCWIHRFPSPTALPHIPLISKGAVYTRVRCREVERYVWVLIFLKANGLVQEGSIFLYMI